MRRWHRSVVNVVRPLWHTVGTNTPEPMNHLLLPLTVALFCAGPLAAQTPPTIPSDTAHVSMECLLGTKPLEWAALGLSFEQQAQVQAIQTNCETDCVAFKETGSSDPAMSHAILVRHQERIGKILSKEQYDQWIAMCQTRPRKT